MWCPQRTARLQTRQSKKAFPLLSNLPLPLPMPVEPPVPFSGPTRYPDGFPSCDAAGGCGEDVRLPAVGPGLREEGPAMDGIRGR